MMLSIIGMSLLGAAIYGLQQYSISLDDTVYTTKRYTGESTIEEINEKEEIKEKENTKIDYTSYDSWIKEVNGWSEDKVNAKIKRLNAEHYNFTITEARRYIAKHESINGRNSIYGDIL